MQWAKKHVQSLIWLTKEKKKLLIWLPLRYLGLWLPLVHFQMFQSNKRTKTFSHIDLRWLTARRFSSFRIQSLGFSTFRRLGQLHRLDFKPLLFLLFGVKENKRGKRCRALFWGSLNYFYFFHGKERKKMDIALFSPSSLFPDDDDTSSRILSLPFPFLSFFLSLSFTSVG